MLCTVHMAAKCWVIDRFSDFMFAYKRRTKPAKIGYRIKYRRHGAPSSVLLGQLNIAPQSTVCSPTAASSSGSRNAAPIPPSIRRATAACRRPTRMTSPSAGETSNDSATPEADRFRICAGTRRPSDSTTSTAVRSGTIRRWTRTTSDDCLCRRASSMKRRATSPGDGAVPMTRAVKSQLSAHTTETRAAPMSRMLQVSRSSTVGSVADRSLNPSDEMSTVTAWNSDPSRRRHRAGTMTG